MNAANADSISLTTYDPLRTTRSKPWAPPGGPQTKQKLLARCVKPVNRNPYGLVRKKKLKRTKTHVKKQKLCEGSNLGLPY